MTIPIAPPLCAYCRRFRVDVPWPSPGVCDAFPDGIPKSISERLGDHRRPVTGAATNPEKLTGWSMDEMLADMRANGIVLEDDAR